MFTLLIYLCIFGWLGPRGCVGSSLVAVSGLLVSGWLGLRGHVGSSLVAVSGLLVSLAGWVFVAMWALLWLQ